MIFLIPLLLMLIAAKQQVQALPPASQTISRSQPLFYTDQPVSFDRIAPMLGRWEGVSNSGEGLRVIITPRSIEKIELYLSGHGWHKFESIAILFEHQDKIYAIMRSSSDLNRVILGKPPRQSENRVCHIVVRLELIDRDHLVIRAQNEDATLKANPLLKNLPDYHGEWICMMPFLTEITPEQRRSLIFAEEGKSTIGGLLHRIAEKH